MSTQKRKFELYQRIQALGFTYEEAHALRRIELTLASWGAAECNGEIERNEATGKPERVSQAWLNGAIPNRCAWPIADREAGALKRMREIIDRRNAREKSGDGRRASFAGHVFGYHQSDPRGCQLYLVQRSQIPEWTDEQIRKHSGEYPLKSAEARQRFMLSMYYSNGLAVCC